MSACATLFLHNPFAEIIRRVPSQRRHFPDYFAWIITEITIVKVLLLMYSDGPMHGVDQLAGIVPGAILKYQLDLTNVGDARGGIAVDHDEIR